MTTYAQELLDDTIKCFKEENGLIINEQTASEYLDSMAKLFLAFKVKVGEK